MEIPFMVKDSRSPGVLVHPEGFKGEGEAFMIRATYRADDVLESGKVLHFTEHDGEPIELAVSSVSSAGSLELGPENASDFAVAFGLD
jgi:hypothetical protein